MNADVANYEDHAAVAPPELRRSLSLTMLSLYGIGVTIGAGIYVLVGKVAIGTGMHAPLSFLMAAILAGFTAFSYAELGGGCLAARERRCSFRPPSAGRPWRLSSAFW